jgi:hypothetical protein
VRVAVHAADPVAGINATCLRAFVSPELLRLLPTEDNHPESNWTPVLPKLSHRDGIEPSFTHQKENPRAHITIIAVTHFASEEPANRRGRFSTIE